MGGDAGSGAGGVGPGRCGLCLGWRTVAVAGCAGACRGHGGGKWGRAGGHRGRVRSCRSIWPSGHTLRILLDEIGGILSCKFSTLLNTQTRLALNWF